MQHVWGTGEVHTGFWWGYLMGTDQLERLSVMWEYNIKVDVLGRYGLDCSGSG